MVALNAGHIYPNATCMDKCFLCFQINRDIYNIVVSQIDGKLRGIKTMGNYELLADEVVLYEGAVTSKNYKGTLQLTLTSQKIIFEKENGIFKKERGLIDILPLETVKVYNGAAQVKRKGNTVEVQTVGKNIVIVFAGVLEARKFISNAVNAVTGTTLAHRSSDKIKDAFNMADDTLGIDIRGTIRGFLENGVKGTIINGTGKKDE